MFLLVVLPACWALQTLTSQSPRLRPLRGSYVDLGELVRNKLIEVEALNKEEKYGDVRARLAFVADVGNYRMSEALRRPADDEGRHFALIADIKRRSPHYATDIADFDDAGLVARRFARWPVDALCLSTDARAYGGSPDELVGVRRATRREDGARPPVLMKDLIVDPIQIALAAERGADAVVLIACVLGARLPELLDVATLAGVEAAVEVHTPNECEYALSQGATLIIATNRDRANGGELHPTQALGLKQLIPPNIVAVACGGVETVAQARRMALAGYDAVMVGRGLVRREDGLSPTDFARGVRDLRITPAEDMAWGPQGE